MWVGETLRLVPEEDRDDRGCDCPRNPRARDCVLDTTNEKPPQLERHSITPEELYRLRASDQEVLLFDVRLPLDLLADSKIIPGAIRIPPQEIRENPALIPRDKDTIVYCTCPSDETSRGILQKALALQITRIRFLKGGLDGWKAKGYPVEPYTKSFRLDTAS